MTKIKNGFTLIELLVVISIVTLLASVILGSLANARVKSNNANMNRMILQYANAAELYQSKYGTYPPAPSYSCLGTGYPTTNQSCGWCGNTGSATCNYSQGGLTAGPNSPNPTTLQVKFSEFITSYPPVSTRRFFADNTSANTGDWLGALYDYSAGIKQFYWVLEGQNQSCARPPNAVTMQQYNRSDGTQCIATLP